jgi:regulator of protease activity HflC (stomatin/prohibitin superfamily)
MAFAVLLAIFAFVLFAFVLSAVKVIRPYQRGLVERLGKYHATVEPGLRMIYPVVDRMVRVDMRETVVDVPPQEVITSDNVVVTVDAVVYYEATDPRRLIYNVSNFIQAVVKLAQTNLRNVIGDMELDEALTSSESINARLRDILDDATDKWGTRVVRVEIQRIEPPVDVVESMHHQMRAERTRRAVVTEAEGNRSAAITNAEGEKAAAVLQAEALKQSAILESEGRALAIKAVADAEAKAIERVYAAIHEGDPTPDLLAVKYLEALQHMANGRATKIFLPTEATALLGALGGMKEMLEQASGSKDNGARRRPVRPRRPVGS